MDKGKKVFVSVAGAMVAVGRRQWWAGYRTRASASFSIKLAEYLLGEGPDELARTCSAAILQGAQRQAFSAAGG